MEQMYRYDLYISCHGAERVSPSFTMSELAVKTKTEVENYREYLRTKPAVFIESTALRGNIESTVEAILQTRPNGVVLFLITPEFFSDRRCVSEFLAFREVQLDPEVNLKLILVCLGFVEGNLGPSVEEQVRDLSCFSFRTDFTVTSIEDTSASLKNVVFEAFECTESHRPQDLPTVLGGTCSESFRALQSEFTDDDVPVFRAVHTQIPISEKNILNAFAFLSDRNIVTEKNVKGLKEVIKYQNGPRKCIRLGLVEGYERKWELSHQLDWRDNFRENLFRLLEDKSNEAFRGSSSTSPEERICYSSGIMQGSSRIVSNRPPVTEEEFKPFDMPIRPCNIFLDFGDPKTKEGLLLQNVLEPFNGKERFTVSAIGKPTTATLGMGGVGKTTTLKQLCYEEEVKKVYRDGVCFLEFGQDADDRKVIKQVIRCVGILVGRTEAQEMNALDELTDVLERAAQWLRNRTVLLVCDDLWKNKKSKYGYLQDIKILLREAPRSSLVISTRDRNIASIADEVVEFSSLDVEGDQAREILLAGVPGIDARANNPDAAVEECIRRILRICAGLPLALAIAGRGLAKTLLSCTSVSNGVRRYCKLIEQDLVRLTGDELEDYPGLARVIELSLKHCQEWGMSSKVEKRFGHKLDMEDMFKGLCVLEKQMVMPKRALKQVWGTDDRCTDDIMHMFADCNLATCCESGLSTEHEDGLHLHDLVLTQCLQMTRLERSKWHKQLVDEYAKKVGADRNVEDGGESRPWWRADDDGYFYGHLSRHLVLSGCAEELRSLLCDVRWTMRRMEVGGMMSLKSDFERLFGAQKNGDRIMRRVLDVLMNSMPYAREKHELLAFYICAHLSAEERKESCVSTLYQSVCRHFPKPWLQPVTRFIAAKDEREKWKAVFEWEVQDLAVDWRSKKVFIAHQKGIVAWCTEKQRELFDIPYTAVSIAISADGKVIATGGFDETVRLWDAVSGTPICDPLCGHEDIVRSVAFSTNGKVIVSGSVDKTVRLWDVERRAPIGDPLRGHEDWVNCVALSANGKLIVSGSNDTTLRLWDVERQAPIGDPLREREGWVNCVVLSANGKLIVSGSSDETLRLWDVERRAPIGDPLCGHEGQVYCVALSGNDKLIVSCSSDETLRLWDVERRAPIGNPLRGHEDWISCVAVSADGKIIVSGSDDKTVRGWHVENKIRSRVHNLSPENQVSTSRVSSNISSTLPGLSNIRQHVKEGFAGGITCAALSANEKLIVSGSANGRLWLWEGETGAPIGGPLWDHFRSVTCIALSANGKVIVSRSADGTVRRWNAESGAPIGKPLRFTYKSDILCFTHDDVTCVALSGNGKVIVAGSRDVSVRRWNAVSGEPIGYPLCGHEARVVCVAVSPDGKFIASGSNNGTVLRWNTKRWFRVGLLRGEERSWVTCVAISTDGKVVVSGSRDGTVRRWDAERVGFNSDILHRHKYAVDFVALREDGSVFSMSEGYQMWDERAPESLDARQIALDRFLSFCHGNFRLAMHLNSGRVAVVSEHRALICLWAE